MKNAWGEFILVLYTKEELLALEDGTIVVSIFGVPRVKDASIDTDVRCGCTAYGRLVEKPDDGIVRLSLSRDELKRSYDRKCMAHWNFEKWADDLFGSRDGKG